MLLELLRKWLKKRVGIELSIIPTTFTESVKDGLIMAQILLFYNVISQQEYQKIDETNDPSVALENYNNYVKPWLARINLDLTNGDILEIINGEAVTATSLFYEVYMRLENKKGSVLKPRTDARAFIIDKVKETPRDELFFEVNPLCEPLLKQWDIINWEKDHLTSLMARYVKSKEDYSIYLEKKRITDYAKSEEKVGIETDVGEKYEVPPNLNYQELINQQRNVLGMEPFIPDEQKAGEILKEIKKKNRKKAEMRAYRLEMQQKLLSEVWKMIEETEEEQCDKEGLEKLMKKSIFEKEVEEKLLRIKQQKELFIENRKKQEELEKKKRDEEFVRRIFEENLEERMDFHDERMNLINEHKRLYKEKLEKKALKHEKVCKDIVNDLVDLALKTVEYKRAYGFEPDKFVKNEWAALFVNQECILEKLPIEEAEEEPPSIENVPKIQQNREVLDNYDFGEYISFSASWTISDEFTEVKTEMSLGMNCLGYAVHRVLQTKYPFPIPQTPNLSPQIEISVCASNLPDLSKLDYLKRLLDLKGIKVIQMEDAVKFCIEAYETEQKTEFDDPYPEEILKELAPSQKENKKGKKKKKGDKGSKKGKKSEKGSKKSKKGEKKGKKGKKGKEVVEKTFEDKQAQTPVIFPWERLILSKKAQLGKTAKEILEQEGTFNDQFLIDMFIEYLTSLQEIKGWVLLNFPNSYEQAALLEQALSGKPAPEEYYDQILNMESLESIIVETVPNSSVSIPQTCEEEEEEVEGELSEVVINSCEELQEEAKPPIEEQLPILSELTARASELTTITLQETYYVTPELRVTVVLPDLKHLAYPSDDEVDVSSLSKEDKPTCVCMCNTNTKPKTTESSSEIKKEEETSKPVPIEVRATCSSVATSHFKDMGEEDKEKPQVIDTIEENKVIEEEVTPTEENEVCFCFAVPEEIKVTIEFREQAIQTDDVDDAVLAINLNPEGTNLAVDVFKENRESRLVPNLFRLKKDEYCTVLTAYIKIKNKDEENDDDVEYPVPIFKELERCNGLEKFYCDQGCFYILEYEELNGEALKCLAKLVIGDYSLPLKNSVEMFGERYGEVVLEVGDQIITKKGKKGKKGKKDKKKKKKSDKGSKKEGKASKKGKKSEKGSKKSKGKKKKDKSSTKSKGKKKGKKGKKGASKSEEITVIEHDDKEIQFPEIVEEEEVPEPRAGEPEWEYINLLIPVDLEMQMANLWDNFEGNYIKGFKDFFFNRRTLIETFGPFMGKVNEAMNELFNAEDQKQYYLREFQKTLNDIDLELRNDEETKNEIFCRIDEFKEKLFGLCDLKMRELEETRCCFITENWLFTQICELVNSYVLVFQFEIDRAVDTIQFISDYYTALITKAGDGYEFHKAVLTPHEFTGKNCDDFNLIFLDVEVEIQETQFHKALEITKNEARSFVESLKELSEKPFKEMRKLLEPKEKEKKQKKKKKHKEKNIEIDEEVKDDSERIFEEWTCAINGEFSRINLVFNNIKNEGLNRLDGLIDWLREIFKKFFDEIGQTYHKEIDCVDRVCDLLKGSVEKEIIIYPELTFQQDQLAEIQITLFPETLINEDEEIINCNFTLDQIEFMVQIFVDLARSGFILRNTFLLLIQDLFYLESEIPEMWRNLSTSGLNSLFKKIFDDEKYLYWKDFIVCNLNVPFPSREELMAVRTEFREFDPFLSERITIEQFNKIVLWFENDCDDVDRIKDIILRMYLIDEEEFNYTAMLLDFCKDEDQVIGFVKALELSLGKFICFEQELGEIYVSEVLEKRRLFEEAKEEHDENLELANRAISLLVDKIISDDGEPEGLTLTEIEENKSKESLKEEKSENKLLSEKKFSYTQIGYESRDNMQYCYFLPFELISIIVRTDITWNLKLDDGETETFHDKIVEIYEECRNESFNNVVLAHEFLNCEKFKQLLSTTNKFLAHNPVRMVKRILKEPSIEEFLNIEEEESENETSTI